MYVTEQPKFLNAVVRGCVACSPTALLEEIKRIERRHGRDHGRGGDKGPRPLDIDILLYDRWIVESPHLVIPHPGITERRFVLEPLLELEPDLVHPVTGVRLRASLDALPDQGVYCYLHKPYNGPASKEQFHDGRRNRPPCAPSGF